MINHEKAIDELCKHRLNILAYPMGFGAPGVMMRSIMRKLEEHPELRCLLVVPRAFHKVAFDRPNVPAGWEAQYSLLGSDRCQRVSEFLTRSVGDDFYRRIMVCGSWTLKLVHEQLSEGHEFSDLLLWLYLPVGNNCLGAIETCDSLDSHVSITTPGPFPLLMRTILLKQFHVVPAIMEPAV